MLTPTDQVPLAMSLRSIYFREAVANTSTDFDPLLPGQQLVGEFRQSGKSTLVKLKEVGSLQDESAAVRGCAFLTRFEFRYTRDGEGDDSERPTASTVSATIAVVYDFREGQCPTDEELRVWGETSALIHSWPYWRQYCQQALMQLSLPPTIMPLLDMKAVIDGVSNKASAPAPARRVRAKKK